MCQLNNLYFFKMKTTSNFFVILAFAFFAMNFVSCGSEPGPENIRAEFSYSVSKDIFELADVILTFSGQDSDELPEKFNISASNANQMIWHKKIDIHEFPDTIGFRVEFKLKEGAMVQEGKISYYMQKGFENTFRVGNRSRWNDIDVSVGIDIPSDQALDYIATQLPAEDHYYALADDRISKLKDVK